MRAIAFGLAGALALGLCVPRAASAVEIDAKALKITLTGRVQAMWSHGSIENGDPSNEFLLRRARMAMRVKVNDLVSGIVEPDFGVTDGKVELKDCYLKIEPSDAFELLLGQTKRRFDLFELVSSTQMLAIERDGRIGRTKVPSLSYLTETLGYSDRDIGLFATGNLADERVTIEMAVTNGSGANKKAEFGEKAFQGRLTLEPLKKVPLALHAGVSVIPHKKRNANVNHSPAFEGSIEWGDYKSGAHLQTTGVWGKNWNAAAKTSYGGAGAAVDSPDFAAGQIVLTYKKVRAIGRWFEAVEPLVRLGYADPNLDAVNDAGMLLTPGVNLFFVNRTRLSANVDIFRPEATRDDRTVPGDQTKVAFGAKVATWLYW